MAQTPCVYKQLGDTLDYTPGSAVAAGTVYVIGSTVVTIVPVAIAATDKVHCTRRSTCQGTPTWCRRCSYWMRRKPYGGGACGAFRDGLPKVFAGRAEDVVNDSDVDITAFDMHDPGSYVPLPVATVRRGNARPMQRIAVDHARTGADEAAIAGPAAAGSVCREKCQATKSSSPRHGDTITTRRPMRSTTRPPCLPCIGVNAAMGTIRRRSLIGVISVSFL